MAQPSSSAATAASASGAEGAGVITGLFGPSLNEKIRRSAAAALPEATWTMDVDWGTGAKLHNLSGVLAVEHTDGGLLQFARDVWTKVASQFRLDPTDARDGLLTVGVSASGGREQRTGTDGQ